MKQPVQLRFIPGWLNNVFLHYRTTHQDFDRIVSKHDLKSFQIANNQLQTRLKFMDIDDFVMPDANMSEGFTEDEALFALYGSKSDGKTVAGYSLTRFRIVPDALDGIVIIEDATQPEQDLVAQLVQALATYRGNTVAYQSSSFLRFLSQVKKYVADPSQVLGVEGLKRFNSKRNNRILASQPLLLGDSTAPLNT